MKIIVNNDDIILFFNRLNNINFKDNYEEEFKKIFIKLKNVYNINVIGFYNVYVYVDKYYGYIIKMIKDDDITSYYKQIDMHVVIENIDFLYKIKDIFFIKNLNKYNIYYYNNNFYLEINKKLSNKEYYTLIENSEIIYEDIIDIIKNKGIKINISNL